MVYHVVWCPKYRRDVLTQEIAETAGLLIDSLCEEHSWPVLSNEIQPDHIQVFLSIPSAITVADVVKILKGITARRLFVQFPELKQRLYGVSLWSPSYYVGTAGNVSAEMIRRYIEQTEHVTKGR